MATEQQGGGERTWEAGRPTGPPLRELAERLGEVEALDPVAEKVSDAARQALSSSPALKDAISGTWFGHALHPPLTDLPIGAWTSATLVDLLGGREGRRAADRLIGIGILTALPTAITGLSDWADSTALDDTIQRAGAVHAAANVTALVLYSASLAARRRNHRGRGVLYGLAGAAAMSVGGYLGGHLSFAKGLGVDQTTFHRHPRDWTRALGDDELPEGEVRDVALEGTPIVLTRGEGRHRDRRGRHRRARAGRAAAGVRAAVVRRAGGRHGHRRHLARQHLSRVGLRHPLPPLLVLVRAPAGLDAPLSAARGDHVLPRRVRRRARPAAPRAGWHPGGGGQLRLGRAALAARAARRRAALGPGAGGGVWAAARPSRAVVPGPGGLRGGVVALRPLEALLRAGRQAHGGDRLGGHRHPDRPGDRQGVRTRRRLPAHAAVDHRPPRPALHPGGAPVVRHRPRAAARLSLAAVPAPGVDADGLHARVAGLACPHPLRPLAAGIAGRGRAPARGSDPGLSDRLQAGRDHRRLLPGAHPPQRGAGHRGDRPFHAPRHPHPRRGRARARRGGV